MDKSNLLQSVRTIRIMDNGFYKTCIRGGSLVSFAIGTAHGLGYDIKPDIFDWTPFLFPATNMFRMFGLAREYKGKGDELPTFREAWSNESDLEGTLATAGLVHTGAIVGISYGIGYGIGKLFS